MREGRLSRLAGCEYEEAWFDLMSVFIGYVAITGWSFPECCWMPPEIPYRPCPRNFFSWPGMLAAPYSGSGAPRTYTLSYSHGYAQMTQDVVQNRVCGTKYSGDSRQVKSFYLLLTY